MPQAASHRLVTLAQLADEPHYRVLLASILEHTTVHADAAITLLHQALHAAADALLGPLAFEGITYFIEADQLGLVNDLRTELPRVWIGRRHQIVTLEPARHIVAAIHRLIDPIVELTMLHGGIGSRQASSYVLEELRIRCGQFAHTIGVGYAEGWPNDLLSAVAPLATARRLAA
jgi:hypothetical protein